MAMVGLMGEEP